MKIMYVVESLGGGVLSYLSILCNEMVKKGNDVTLLYGIRNQTPKDLSNIFDENVNLIKIDSFKRSISLSSDYRAYKEVKRNILKVNPDVVHLNSSKAGALGRIIKFINFIKLRKVAFFYTPHGYSFLMGNESFIKRKVYYSLEKILSELNTTTIACGEGEYFYSKKLGKKSTFVNNCIDEKNLDKFKSNSSNTENIIYTVGRICSQKNPELFNKIAERNPQKKFVWVGDGELSHKLTSKNIKITGWLNSDDLMKVIQPYKYFILTSKWEGMPMALLEAEFFNKIIMVSPIHGNIEVVNDAGGNICYGVNDYSDVINGKRKNENREFPYTLNSMVNGYERIYMKELDR